MVFVSGAEPSSRDVSFECSVSRLEYRSLRASRWCSVYWIQMSESVFLSIRHCSASYLVSNTPSLRPKRAEQRQPSEPEITLVFFPEKIQSSVYLLVDATPKRHGQASTHKECVTHRASRALRSSNLNRPLWCGRLDGAARGIGDRGRFAQSVSLRFVLMLLLL